MRDALDVLVVGSGIAGLTFALNVARDRRVLVVTKKARAESNTNFARGGIAAGVGPDDDPELHLEDTLSAGAGLCHRDVVELVVREGPARVRELIEWGVRFHQEEGRLSLGMEGGHSRRRILHAGDRTGREIERGLLAAAEDAGVRIVEHLFAVDLLVERDVAGAPVRCRGALALDDRTGQPVVLDAPVTLLATGGCGQVYRHTTNPAIATGDGVAMAYRAGARIANMEFIQFHPTALYPTEDPAFLLSEALRGEGAFLRRRDGSRFMEEHHPRGSLAPRDVVARAIHAELKRSGEPHVVLDVSAIPPVTLETRFPGTAAGCRERGIDPYEEGIPVVPAAHYVCGGVETDTEARTSLPGLFAAGEVACTGVHGANRLASNSLLEAVVFTHRAAEAVMGETEPGAGGADSSALEPAVPRLEGEAAEGGSPWESEAGVGEARARLRELMWEKVGIVRSDEELEEAAQEIEGLVEREEERWARGPRTIERAELRNLLATSSLVVRCARARKESRGLHFNRDHPEPDERFLRDTMVEPAVAQPEGG